MCVTLHTQFFITLFTTIITFMKRLLLLVTAVWLACMSIAAAPNIVCTGVVVDEQNEPMVGATVTATGTKVATATDADGKFRISVPDNCKELAVTFIGYRAAKLAPKADMGTIALAPDSKMLDNVVVTQSVGKTRETPVAMSTIDSEQIEFKLGSQGLMEMLKTTPGVYTRSEGGGFGDAETRMRGFKSQNVAVVINGIPVNDMENGAVYQSNWANLSDVAASIQTQRGLGANIVSTPSIGGTINITTRTIDVKKGGSVWYGMGNDGMNQFGIKLSTGLMKNGWAITVLGARKWADGYIQGTAYDSYSYFVNITKRINDAHQIGFTAFGAPQWHDKRNYLFGLTVEGWQGVRNYMDGESPYRFNPSFGYRKNGKAYNSAYNEYHKPQMALNHIWQINETSSLSTSLYASISSGGGRAGQGRDGYSYTSWYGAQYGDLNNTFRTTEGWIDYGMIEDMNAASTNGSKMIMSMSNNSHQWYGLISSYKKEFNFKNDSRLNLTAGLDMRYYMGEHNNKITDLFGGAYYIDDETRGSVNPADNPAAADPEWVNQKLQVGDIVYRNYRGYVMQEGIFGQAEYTMLDRKLNLVLAGAFNNNTYWRRDYLFYDAAKSESATSNFVGGTIKAGANYNINRNNNVFFNIGYISRAPFFKNVYMKYDRSNILNEDAKNEKIFSVEVGYGYHSPKFALTANAYLTKWYDRSMVKSGLIDNPVDGSLGYVANMSGIGARHMGVELEAKYKPVKWLELDAMVSVGNWIWDTNATAYFYNQLGQPLKTLKGNIASGIMAPDHLKATLEQKGGHVDGMPQTTASFAVTFKPVKGLRFGAEWNVMADLYSDIYIEGSSLSDNKVLQYGDPWRIPWGNQLDLNASYRFKLGGLDATLYGNVHNVCDYNYITQAQTPTGAVGDWKNAYMVFYSLGRTYSLKLKINF